MDSSFTLVPFTPQQETSAPDWAPFAAMSLMALTAVVRATLGEEEESEDQTVLESSLEEKTAAKSPRRAELPGLEEAVLSSLSSAACGLRAKDLVRLLRPSHAEVTKSDINSTLYKLLNKKVVAKSTDPAPLWVLRG